MGAFKVYLSWHLFIVGLVSYFGCYQAYFSPGVIREYQFNLKPEQVSPLALHLFGAWTLLSSTIRLLCSFYLHEKGIYLITMFTFVVALVVYLQECFIEKTISFSRALAPFIVASSTFTLMLIYLLFCTKTKETEKKSK